MVILYYKLGFKHCLHLKLTKVSFIKDLCQPSHRHIVNIDVLINVKIGYIKSSVTSILLISIYSAR